MTDNILDKHNPGNNNHKIRVTVRSRPRLLKESFAYVKAPDVDIGQLLGTDDEGVVLGTWNNPVTSGKAGFPDSRIFCSEDCFWKKSNRNSAMAQWSESEKELLESLMPAYCRNKRGSCMLAIAVDKPCVEVFKVMLSVPVESRNDRALNEPKVPSKTMDLKYWHKNHAFRLDIRRAFNRYTHEGSCEDQGCRCIKKTSHLKSHA